MGARRCSPGLLPSSIRPGRVAVVAGCIGKAEVARKLVLTAVERFGGVGVLVNNAGIFKPTPFPNTR